MTTIVLRLLINVLVFAAIAFGFTTSSFAQQPARQLTANLILNSLPRVETKAERDGRMQWWREARFGMFIHWGLYAVPAGEYKGKRSETIGEWIMEWASIPRADYEKFAAQFNPVKFNAAEWVRRAKDAGMKYIVITSKHHDGFSMYDSRISNYDMVDATPYGKDPMKALAAAARKQGLKFCFYYSILDWHRAHLQVRGQGQTEQGLKAAVDPGKPEV